MPRGSHMKALWTWDALTARNDFLRRQPPRQQPTPPYGQCTTQIPKNRGVLLDNLSMQKARSAYSPCITLIHVKQACRELTNPSKN